MSTFEMETADILKLKDAHIASLEEELVRERARRASAEAEADLAFETMRKVAWENIALKKQQRFEPYEQ
jgi:hypothetical protein